MRTWSRLSYLAFLALGVVPGGCSGGGGSSGMYPCSPPAACQAGAACISLADNKGASSFGLRMSTIAFDSPAVFKQGIFAMLFQSFLLPSQKTCNLNGTATFNWLLQFDSAANKLRTGGAKPAGNAGAGYAFVNESIMLGGRPVQVQPVTFDIDLSADGKFSSKAAQDLVMPIYLDTLGSSALPLPLQKVGFTNGQLSADRNCIGSYNAQGLDPAKKCAPDDTHPAFLTGGQVAGLMTLEDADAVPVTQLGQSLCVFLSGDVKTYGDGASPQKCKRDDKNKIVFKGDWCSMSNQAGDCADAMRLTGSFAASAVKING